MPGKASKPPEAKLVELPTKATNLFKPIAIGFKKIEYAHSSSSLKQWDGSLAETLVLASLDTTFKAYLSIYTRFFQMLHNSSVVSFRFVSVLSTSFLGAAA